MSQLRILIVILGVILVCVVGSQLRKRSLAGDPETTRAEVRQVLDAQQEAWNRGDLEGFMEGYWRSEDLQFFSGADVAHGWQAALQRYRQRYQGEGKEMGRLTFQDVRIEALEVDHALVRGRWQVVAEKGTSAGLFTLIFQRFPEGWRIVHDHTSR